MANGAERLVEAAREAGIQTCFANPGTTELPLVSALESVGGIRAVLGLHENVCTGAADGYGRLAPMPAMTLLHLGPGFANGIANLHNARRAGSPVVSLIGEHASWHIANDPPLAMDIESAAATVSGWQRRIASADDAAPALRAALRASITARGAVASLIFPHDHQLAPAGATMTPPAAAERGKGYATLDSGLVEQAARNLGAPGRKLLLLGGAALFGEGLTLAGRIARRTGASLIGEVGFARMESGRGLPPVQRLPYFPEMAQETLDGFQRIVVIGAKSPVSFFGYADKPSRYLADHPGTVLLAGQEDDALAALQALADRLEARLPWQQETEAEPLALPEGALDAAKLGQVLAALQPEDAVIVLTAVSSAAPYSAIAHRAQPHTQLALTGGAIGEGPALALGAAIAAPGRKVINLEADGSGAYILQALWSHAREQLDIITIICANRRYNILQLELERAGTPIGPVTRSLTDLGRPPLDWVSLARGFGVPGERVATAGEMAAALGRALATPGPTLIEALI